MELNLTCIRDLLIYLEKELTLDDSLMFQSIDLTELADAPELNQYSRKELFYTIYNLEQVGFIQTYVQYADNSVYICEVENINYTGHEFLQNIKPLSVWQSLKQKLKPLGSASLPVISQVASQIIHSKLLDI